MTNGRGHHAILAAVLAAGCGRLEFDLLGGGAGGSDHDAASGSDAAGRDAASLCGDMSALALDAPWPLIHGCPTNAGRSRAVGPAAIGTRRGPVALGANLNRSIATVGGGGRAYLQGGEGADTSLVAFDLTTMTARWVNGEAVNGDPSPALGANGRLYATTDYGVVFVHDLDTGNVLDQSQYLGSYPSPILAGDGRMYFGSDQYGFYALDQATLAQRWHLDGSVVGHVASAAAVGGGVVYALDVTGARLLAFDAASGVPRFPARSLGTAPWGSPVLVGDLVAVATDAGLVALDAATGVERWRYAMAERAVQPAVLASGALVTATASGAGVIVDRSGALLRQVDFGASLLGPPVVDAADAIYVGTSIGVRSFSAVTGALRWSDPTVGEPAIGDGMIVVVTEVGSELVTLGP